MNAIELESKRLILKPLSLLYLKKEYVNWMNDHEVNKYLSSGNDYTLEKLKIFLSDVEKKNILFWAICLKHNQKHIGNIKIDPVELKHGICEYGILMGDKNEWGKGYAFECSNLVIKYLFESLRLRKINLGVYESNTKAIKLYKKLGFKIEGKFIKHHNHRGEFENIIRMALFNPNQ